MSLTTRLSIFFLAALAVVLIGFSVTLYVLATVFLEQQLDERLNAALDTMEATVDRDNSGLEWDPHDLHQWFGKETTPEAVRWQVDSGAKRLDSSTNLVGADLRLAKQSEVDKSDRGVLGIEHGGRSWKTAWRRLRAPQISSRQREGQDSRHSTLLLSVGLPLEPMQGVLQRLTVTLMGLSAAVWTAAALAGRWMCRKALAPVTRMAAAARNMGAADLGHRLPNPGSSDELGDLHCAFNGLLDRLQDAFERQRRFTGDASHQLRTPLAAMLGQVEVALRREREADDYRHVLSLIQNQAEHLRRIVEALLFLARADGDANLARLEPVDLGSWLPEYLQGWTHHPRARSLNVKCVSATVSVQPTLLSQLLDNLLDNAFKYSAMETAVKITVERTPKGIALAVEDSGPGIAADELPHIFEPFYRSAEARRFGHAGVGLGLAMAQRIAAALNGVLVAESEIGRGSRFKLVLPATENRPQPPDAVHSNGAT